MRARYALIALLAGVAGAAVDAKPLAAAGQGPQIAITIDDLDVNADDTPRLSLDQRNEAILATLRRARVKAAVFVTGKRVDGEVGKRHLLAWDQEGHLIANHSYSHLLYHTTSFDDFSNDVLRGEALIKDYAGFRKLFRFPYLKEGATIEQRDSMRSFLQARGYRMGYVTVDASDWAIDARLRRRLAANANADVSAYRDFYLEHIWARAVFYDELSKQALGRSPRHTLLIHHNLLAALFLEDLLHMFREKGWRLIDAAEAFDDPVFSLQPDIVPAGESIIWGLAKAAGEFAPVLRYPGEDESYEESRMNALGL